jgi:hypothetical protein
MSRGADAAIFIAAFLLLLTPFGGLHATALAASASALALLTAAVLRWAGAVPLTGSADLARGAVPTRSSVREVVVLPQRDPDAAGKPRPRAPARTR